jgi:ATP-dependent protease Clp ATPase subunit
MSAKMWKTPVLLIQNANYDVAKAERGIVYMTR